MAETLDLHGLHLNPVHIYLHDMTIPDQAGESKNSGVSPATIEFRVVYRPDTPSTYFRH